jgi:hypothetical protein
MSRSLKIAGVERWAEDYIGESLEIDLQLYGEINTCKFQVRGTEPVKGEEVLLTDSSLGVLFAGIIVRVEMREKMPGVSVPIWEVDCDDYTALLNKRLVVEDYTGWTATAIVQDICSKYCPDVTIAGVVEGAPVIEYIRFDYQTPQECFNRIAEYVNWIWDIDFTKDIKFYNLETVGDTAPMELIPGGYFRSLKHSVDIQDLRNRVYVRGGTMLSDFYTHETVADGTSRAWILPHSPHEITMAISGVQKTVGIENIHDAAEYDFLMNFQEKRITASPQTTTPVTGATITWTYKYDVDIITVIDDFISQDLLAGVQGGDGVYEHVINDDKLDTIEAAEIAGVNDLTQYANPTVKGSFETEINGWKPGQLVTISLEDRGISGMFLIQNVSIEIATDTKYTYKIQYGGKLKGVADFLKALFSAKEQTDVGETNILNKFFTESETILVTENWTFTERVLPFIVENDTEFSINNTEVRMEVQDDFTQGTLTGLTGADGTLKFTNTTVPTISQNDTLSSSNSKSGVTIRNSALELELDAPTHLSFDGVDDYIEIHQYLR